MKLFFTGNSRDSPDRETGPPGLLSIKQKKKERVLSWIISI